MNQQAQALGRLAKGKRKTMTPEAVDARKRNLARANEVLKAKRAAQLPG